MVAICTWLLRGAAVIGCLRLTHERPLFQHILLSATPETAPGSLAFRAAMRKLAGAVSVLSVGQGEARTGLTATSVSSLSVDRRRCW